MKITKMLSIALAAVTILGMAIVNEIDSDGNFHSYTINNIHTPGIDVGSITDEQGRVSTYQIISPGGSFGQDWPRGHQQDPLEPGVQAPRGSERRGW